LHPFTVILLQELRGEALFDAASAECHAELMSAAKKLAALFLIRAGWDIITRGVA